MKQKGRVDRQVVKAKLRKLLEEKSQLYERLGEIHQSESSLILKLAKEETQTDFTEFAR